MSRGTFAPNPRVPERKKPPKPPPLVKALVADASTDHRSDTVTRGGEVRVGWGKKGWRSEGGVGLGKKGWRNEGGVG